MEDITDVTARDPNIEQDVRAIVARIVDGILDTDDSEHPRPAEPASEPGAVADSSDIGIVAIGGDHGGFALKERLGHRLREQGFTVIDLGTDSTDAVDYPDIAAAVARTVARGDAHVGIIIDGAGIGSAMAANKIAGVRAALCHDLSTARNAREHNHANVLTLGAGLTGDVLAWQIAQEFIATPFGPGRHARRVALIDDLDRVRQGVVG